MAFLPDYDALPGIGHGSGHNLIAIAIAGIGAGLALRTAGYPFSEHWRRKRSATRSPWLKPVRSPMAPPPLEFGRELVAALRNIEARAALITGATLDFGFPERATTEMVMNYTLARVDNENLDAVGTIIPDAKPDEASGSTAWGNVYYLTPSVEMNFPMLDHVCARRSQDVDAADFDER